MDDGETMDGIRRRIVRVVLVPLSALPRRSSEEKSAIHGWRKKALRRHPNRQRLAAGKALVGRMLPSGGGAPGDGQEDAQLLAGQRSEHHRRDIQPVPCPHGHL